MKDVKIGTIQPIREPRATQKQTRKGPASGVSFQQELARISADTGKSAPAAAPGDTKAILDGAAAHAKHMDTMRRVEQQLREQYQNVTRKPTSGQE